MYLRKDSKRFEALGGVTLSYSEMNARRQALFMDTHSGDPIKAMAIVCACVEGWEDKTPDDLMDELSVPMLTEISSAIFALSGVDEEKKPSEADTIAGSFSN